MRYLINQSEKSIFHHFLPSGSVTVVSIPKKNFPNVLQALAKAREQVLGK
tara:strand:- start:1129 stop:1278 length:150 start_codon:yes stop_codon:yes gene_type:complete